MTKKLLILGAMVAVVMLAACDRRQTDGNSTVGEAPDTDAAAAKTQDTVPTAATSMPETAVPAPATDANAPNGDTQALSMLAAINQHEIDAAKQAVGKGVTGAVAEYAALMEKEHGDNQAKTLQMVQPVDTPDVAKMKADGQQELQALAQKNGADYAKAYMQAMVTGHEKALATIDSSMLPMAQSEQAKTHLTQTRAHVANHLERAKAIVAKQG
jgi:putative membrane protein